MSAFFRPQDVSFALYHVIVQTFLFLLWLFFVCCAVDDAEKYDMLWEIFYREFVYDVASKFLFIQL